MTVVAECRVVRIPMRMAVRHAAATRTHTASLVVQIEEGAHTGWGEGAPRRHVHGAGTVAELRRLQAACAALRTPTAPRPWQAGPAGIEAWLDVQGLGPGGRCALELALLDLWARSQDAALLDLLGPPQREHLTYSGLLPLLPPPAEAAALHRIKAEGFADLKVKLSGLLAEDTACLGRVRAALGSRLAIRVDYNGSLAPAAAAAAGAMLADHGVSIVEQPVSPGDREGLLRVREALPASLSLLLDDTVRSEADYQAARADGVCDRLLLKVSKHGGLLATLRLAQRAQADGVPTHLGCHVGETSILSAAGRIAAALHPFETLEGCYGPIILCWDLCAAPLGFDAGGVARVGALVGAGLGIAVRLPQDVAA